MDELGSCAQITNEKTGPENQGSQGTETKPRNKTGNNSSKNVHTEDVPHQATLSKGNI